MNKRIARKKFSWNVLVFGALCLMLLAAPLMRGLFYNLEFMQAQIFLAGMLGLLALIRIFQRTKRITIRLQDILVVIFAAAYALTPLWAVHHKEAVIGVYRVIGCAVVYFLATHLTAGDRRRNTLFGVIFASTVLVSLAAFLATAGFMGLELGGEFAYSKRMSSTLEYMNTFAIFAALGVIIGFGLWQRARSVITRSIIAAGIYLNVLGAMATQSRGSWLMLALGLIILFVAIGRKALIPYIFRLCIVFIAVAISGKGFMDAFLMDETGAFIFWLVLGLVAVIVLATVEGALPKLWQKMRMPQLFQQALVISLLVILAVTFGTYFAYTGKHLPNPAGEMLAVDVIERAATIGGQDSSFQGRMEMKNTAWALIKDHPMGTSEGGWEAWYHNYQDRLYWSSEVHDHFLQIWVEGGTIAFLAYSAFWIVLFWQVIRKLIGYIREEEDYPNGPLLAAAAVAAFILLLHSAFDFDLSLTAVAFILWALAGALGNEVDEPLWQRKQKIPAPITPLVLLIMAAVLFSPAMKELPAQVELEAAKQAVANQYYPRAIDKLERVLEISPDDGEAAGLLALQYAKRYELKGSEEYLAQGMHYAKLAEELHPREVKTRWRITESMRIFGDAEELLRQQEELVKIAPKWPLAYQKLGESLSLKLMGQLEEGNARRVSMYAAQLFEVGETAERNYILSRKNYLTKPAPRIYFMAGQAALLLNDEPEAQRFLELALKEGIPAKEVMPWLILAYQNSDPEKQAKMTEQYLLKDVEMNTEYTRLEKLIGRI